MRIIAKSIKSKRANVSSVPNVIAFSFVRNWLSEKKYSKDRALYCIGNLSSQEVNLAMKEIKWLSRTYKDLNIITVEDKDGNITQVVL